MRGRKEMSLVQGDMVGYCGRARQERRAVHGVQMKHIHPTTQFADSFQLVACSLTQETTAHRHHTSHPSFDTCAITTIHPSAHILHVPHLQHPLPKRPRLQAPLSHEREWPNTSGQTQPKHKIGKKEVRDRIEEKNVRISAFIHSLSRRITIHLMGLISCVCTVV